MGYHFNMDAWLLQVLCFGVQHTGFEPEEVTNINLHIQSITVVKMKKRKACLTVWLFVKHSKFEILN